MLQSYLEGANSVDAEMQAAMRRGYEPVRRPADTRPQLNDSLSGELERAVDRILEYESQSSDADKHKNAESRVARIVTYLQKQAYLTGAASRRTQYGENLVLVVLRSTGTEECARYVGRVFVDDVYSDGEMYQSPSGYGTWHAPSDRFARRGRYPMLSEAIKGGLYHYGCKCWHVSFFEGVTDTNSHGEKIPNFVDHETSSQVQTEHQETLDTDPDTDLREQRMQNYARIVEAATLAREAEMGSIVNLRQWFENSLRFIQERYSNVSGSMSKKPGTSTITVRLSANGISGYAEFRDVIDGTRIDRDGNIFVDPQVLWNAFGRVIDPPIVHTPVRDSIRFGLGVGAVRGVGRVVNWLDRIASYTGRTGEFSGRQIPSQLGNRGAVDGGNTSARNTQHGNQRLFERGFSDQEIALTRTTNNIKTQADGARVYIKEISPGRFNVIVKGDRGVITAFRNIRQSSFDRLSKNYGWR